MANQTDEEWLNKKVYNHLVWLLKNCDPLLQPGDNSISIIFQVEKEISRFKSRERLRNQLVRELQYDMGRLEDSYIKVVAQLERGGEGEL